VLGPRVATSAGADAGSAPARVLLGSGSTAGSTDTATLGTVAEPAVAYVGADVGCRRRPVAAHHRARLDTQMIPTPLEPFWPSRRTGQFDQWCSRAA
jgi:hypothetical protein